MKANELMIGDWVDFYHPHEPEKKIITRHRITETFECGLVGISDHDNPVHADHIEPVKITPEILKKNGFVENRGITSWKFETNREDLIDIYGVDDYHLSINIEDTHGSGKGYRWMLNNLTIFYVHQLQHALRLCGIDKTIEL